MGHVTFGALQHVNAVDAAPIAGIGETNRHLGCIALGLPDTFCQFLIERFCLHNTQFGIAVNQNVVGNLGLPTPSVAFEATLRDVVLAQDATALDQAPTRRLKGGINMLGSGLGFVHRIL